MFVVWMLSLSAIGMPWSGPPVFFWARSRSSASASSSAFGFTVMAALSLSSYVAIRTRYCWTSSREVMRFSASAFCISGMVASTTVNGGGGAFFFSFAWAGTATSRQGRSSSRFKVILAEEGRMIARLFRPQGLHRFQVRGMPGGVEPESNPDGQGDQETRQQHPRRERGRPAGQGLDRHRARDAHHRPDH